MARLSADQWETIRAEREAGASFPDLSKRHGVSHQAIQKRAKTEGWGDGLDTGGAIQRKVAEKVAGVVAGCNPKKRAAAIDAAADEVAGIVRQHREEWAEHARLFPTRAIAEDFDLGKSAKISAEVLTIRQAGQRKAWNMDAPAQADSSGPLRIEVVRIDPMQPTDDAT